MLEIWFFAADLSNKQIHINRELNWFRLPAALPHGHQISSPLINPEDIHLVAIRHPDLGIALHAHRPLDASNSPYIRVRPEAVKYPEDIVALIHEHEIRS